MKYFWKMTYIICKFRGKKLSFLLVFVPSNSERTNNSVEEVKADIVLA